MGHGQNKNIALLQTINWFTNHEWAKKYYCNGRTFHFQESRCSQQMKLPVLNAFIRAWELYYRWYRTGYEVVGIEDERKLLLDPPPLPPSVPCSCRGDLRKCLTSDAEQAWRGDQWQSCSHAELGTAAMQHTSAAWSSLSEGDPRRDVMVLMCVHCVFHRSVTALQMLISATLPITLWPLFPRQ